MNDTLVKKRDSFQLPVYIVVGENWEAEIKLEEKDLVLTGEDIILDEDEEGKNPDDLVYFYEMLLAEAGTKALEIFRGLVKSDDFLIYDDKPAEVGSTLFIFPKNEDPEVTGIFIPSFICFGNAGLYKDAKIAFDLYKKEIKDYEREQLKKKKVKKNKKKK